MKQKRKKTRSVASYRAASLKGARTRKRMTATKPFYFKWIDPDWNAPRTIDRLPKVQWP